MILTYPDSSTVNGCGSLSPSARCFPTPINQLQLKHPYLLKSSWPFPADVLGFGKQTFFKSLFEVFYSLERIGRSSACFCSTAPLRDSLLWNQFSSKAFTTHDINKWKKQLLYLSVFDKRGENFTENVCRAKLNWIFAKLMRDGAVSYLSAGTVRSQAFNVISLLPAQSNNLPEATVK